MWDNIQGLWGYEVGWVGSGSCSMSGYGTGGVEPSDSTVTVSVI
jgi:hypothetical protein